MKTLFEVVKTLDLEPFQAGDGDAFRFRLEILHDLSADSYKGKVYRLETYRLQPTFPQSKESLPDWKNDALIYVADDMFDSDALTGISAQEVVDKFQRTIGDIFSRNQPAGPSRAKKNQKNQRGRRRTKS